MWGRGHNERSGNIVEIVMKCQLEIPLYQNHPNRISQIKCRYSDVARLDARRQRIRERKVELCLDEQKNRSVQK